MTNRRANTDGVWGCRLIARFLSGSLTVTKPWGTGRGTPRATGSNGVIIAALPANALEGLTYAPYFGCRSTLCRVAFLCRHRYVPSTTKGHPLTDLPIGHQDTNNMQKSGYTPGHQALRRRISAPLAIRAPSWAFSWRSSRTPPAHPTTRPMREVKNITERHISDIRRRINELKRLEGVLSTVVIRMGTALWLARWGGYYSRALENRRQ